MTVWTDCVPGKPAETTTLSLFYDRQIAPYNYHITAS